MNIFPITVLSFDIKTEMDKILAELNNRLIATSAGYHMVADSGRMYFFIWKYDIAPKV